jgi:hypothetical protein
MGHVGTPQATVEDRRLNPTKKYPPVKRAVFDRGRKKRSPGRYEKFFSKMRVLAHMATVTVLLSVVSLSQDVLGQTWDKLGQNEFSLCAGQRDKQG